MKYNLQILIHQITVVALKQFLHESIQVCECENTSKRKTRLGGNNVFSQFQLLLFQSLLTVY